MDPLDTEKIYTLRKKLQFAAKALENQLESNRSASEVVTLDQTLVGRVSRIDALQQQNMAISTREQAQTRLRAIRRALQLIDIEEYGFCARCDDSIAFERLNARPETLFCLACQEQIDRQ